MRKFQKGKLLKKIKYNNLEQSKVNPSIKRKLLNINQKNNNNK